MHELANVDARAGLWEKQSRTIVDRVFKIDVTIFSNTCNNYTFCTIMLNDKLGRR